MTRHLPRKLEGLLLVTCVWLGACAPPPDLVEILDLVRSSTTRSPPRNVP